MHEHHPHARLIGAATANRGLATVAMALSCGLSESTFRRLVRREGWALLQPGVWLLPGVTPDWRTHLHAGRLHAGGAVAATGAVGLLLHGIERGLDTSEVLLATPAARNVRGMRAPVTMTRCSALRDTDIVVRQNVEVTAVAWSLAHLGLQASDRQVLIALTAARQGEVVTLAEVDDVLDRGAGMPGIGPLRRARRRFEVEQPDSGLEWDIRGLARKHGIAFDPAPFPFWLPGRGPVIHLDLPISWAWTAWEGEAFHTHGRDERTFDLDRERWSRAKRAGWDIGWITRSRLRTDPIGIVEEIREVLATADPRRPPPRATRCRRPGCAACHSRFGR